MTETHFSACISAILRGDMQGLKVIYEEYGKAVYSAALQICKDRHTAEDVTSEFFLKLKKAASVYREGMGHKKWLFSAVRNLTIDIMRRESREIPMSPLSGEDDSHPLPEIPDSADTEEKVTSEMSASELLMRLPEAEREIVNLKIYCGLTFAEISGILKIPQGTAAWRYQSAIKKLKKVYEEVRI